MLYCFFLRLISMRIKHDISFVLSVLLSVFYRWYCLLCLAMCIPSKRIAKDQLRKDQLREDHLDITTSRIIKMILILKVN